MGGEPYFQFAEHYSPRIQPIDVLKLSHSRSVRDPVDKVYGAHSICEWLDIYLPPPRYDQSIEDTYFDVACNVIAGYDDLSVLYEASGPARNENLPSWVPDWASGWKRMYGVPILSIKDFSAGGKTVLYSIELEKRLLRLKCKFMDEIDQVGARIAMNEDMSFFAYLESEWPNYEAAEDSWATWQVFREWASLVYCTFSESNAANDDFLSTLVDDSFTSVRSRFGSQNAKLEPERARAAFERWYNALLETDDMAAKETTQQNKDVINRTWFGRSICWEANERDLRWMHLMIWFCAKGKRFFITKRTHGLRNVGHRIETKNRRGRRFDNAAGPGPFGERSRLIGHTYVHGIMKGEAWPADSKELTIVSVE